MHRLPIMLFTALLASLSLVAASPVARQAPGAPTVKINDTVITGRSYPSFGQHVYLGIPFAAPPTGELRFKPPQAYAWDAATFNATSTPNACSQDPEEGILQGGKVSEDCLTLNVYKPAIIPAGAKLPVMVWIYGGGFTAGSIAPYNATALVGGSILANRPVVFVAINYRLGIWGFAGGKEAGKNHAGNLGLKDQILGLKWVQENIAAFGGDTEKVTVFGESAGAISIALHYVNPNLGKLDKPLFRNAIMQSGGPSTFPIAEISSSRQAAYDSTVQFAGCANETDTWACLAGLSEEKLLNATVSTMRLPENQQANFPFGPVIDHYLVPESPQLLIQSGQFAKIPFISGNVLDEGTGFFPPTVTTTEQTVAYLRLVLPKQPRNDTVERLLELYPVEDVAAGSPYGTGNQTFGLSPQFKRGASLVGDATFQSSRREFLEYAEVYGLNDTYTFSFEEPAPNATAAGVAHGSDVLFTFGAVSQAAGYSAGAVQVQTALLAYWINYANYGNPNGPATTAEVTPLPIVLPEWPTYSTADRSMLRLKAGNVTIFKDDYRQEQISYINSVGQDLSHRGL